MNKLLLVVLLTIGVENSLNAQQPDTNLFKTWYLTEMTVDLGDSDFVSDVTPGISPILIVNSDLTFEGNLACNGYAGFFTYNATEDLLFLEDYTTTLLDCDFAAHNNFEATHNSYWFDGSNTQIYYEVNENFLYLEFFPGFGLVYQDEPLGVETFDISDVSIYPNPASDELFLKSENIDITQVHVFDISGTKVLEFSENNDRIDVSALAQGLYFLEITSDGKKHLQKFIKK